MRNLMLSVIFTLTLIINDFPGICQNTIQGKWWAGFKSGVNFTQPHIINNYSFFDPALSGSLLERKKAYQPIFKNKGIHLALTFEYYITPSLSISTEPGYEKLNFGYEYSMKWSDTLKNNITLNNKHRTSLDYLSLPLIFKYGFSIQKFRIFIQGGGYYSYLIGGRKTLYSYEEQWQKGEKIEMENFNENFNIKEQLISSQLGLIAGIGISYDINYFRLSLESNFKKGMNNIVNVKNRYHNSRLQLAGYDLSDDYSLSNLEF